MYCPESRVGDQMSSRTRISANHRRYQGCAYRTRTTAASFITKALALLAIIPAPAASGRARGNDLRVQLRLNRSRRTSTTYYACTQVCRRPGEFRGPPRRQNVDTELNTGRPYCPTPVRFGKQGRHSLRANNFSNVLPCSALRRASQKKI